MFNWMCDTYISSNTKCGSVIESSFFMNAYIFVFNAIFTSFSKQNKEGILNNLLSIYIYVSTQMLLSRKDINTTKRNPKVKTYGNKLLIL